VSEKPEILFATLAAGGSHMRVANAMAQAIQTHVPRDITSSCRAIRRSSRAQSAKRLVGRSTFPRRCPWQATSRCR
jgi:hypothetical protein